MVRVVICTLLAFWPSSWLADVAWAAAPRAGQTTTQCVTVATPARLAAGESFAAPIGHRLEFRLTWEGLRAWHVTIGPVGSRDDYVWVVTPPVHTAPHLLIGQGYNVTALQSARFSPRKFRFVTSVREYKEASELVDRALRDAEARITVADIERKGKGTLQLWITGFEPGPSPDSLAWISVKAQACQPR